MQLQRITPCLWFDHQAEEAAGFYAAIFPNSKINALTYYGDAGREFHGKPTGSVMTATFELDGQSFTALNGGPLFQFNEAISLQINCKNQQEVDFIGTGWQPAVTRRRSIAVGLRINTASHGRSFLTK